MSQVIDCYNQELELFKLYEFSTNKRDWEIKVLNGYNINAIRGCRYLVAGQPSKSYPYIRECSVSVGTIRTPTNTLKEPTWLK